MDAVLDMDTARVAPDGRITIPRTVCEVLGLRAGDKVSFSEDADGAVTMRNANARAFEDFQAAMDGAAGEAGFETEDDVVAAIREIRAEGRARRRAARKTA
jgi:AbrB family looped-hinge helix DNA binding protein